MSDEPMTEGGGDYDDDTDDVEHGDYDDVA